MSLVRFRSKAYGRVAQAVEHLTFNQVVRGSNPRTLRLSLFLENKGGWLFLFTEVLNTIVLNIRQRTLCSANCQCVEAKGPQQAHECFSVLFPLRLKATCVLFHLSAASLVVIYPFHCNTSKNTYLTYLKQRIRKAINISQRQVQIHCKKGRIPGVATVGINYIIPVKETRPIYGFFYARGGKR